MSDHNIQAGTIHARQQYGDAMAEFIALVLDDDSLQVRLGEIESPDLYVADVLALASARGIALAEDRVRAAIQPDPLGIGRWMPSPVALDSWPSRGWLPTRVVPTEGAPALDWAWFGEHRLDAPFYEDSIRRFATRPFSLMFRTRTSLETLVEGAAAANSPEPSGFIHHMSRCGSTLVAQMLAADPSHVVLSEPGPFADILCWAVESDGPMPERIGAVRAIVAALGRDRTGATRRIFVKLDSWHTVALPLLRLAFPDTPWVFLYREPVEVLVSQMRQRGSHTVPGLLRPSVIDIPDGEAMEPEHYTALVLARFTAAILDSWVVGGGMLVDYAELPDAAIDRIAPHFGLTPDAGERAAMMAAAWRDAKAPGQRFIPDVAEKRNAATPSIKAAVRTILDPLHARLVSLRCDKSPF